MDDRTIKEATVKRYHYETDDQLCQQLTDFVAAYNFARRLKTLRGGSRHTKPSVKHGLMTQAGSSQTRTINRWDQKLSKVEVSRIRSAVDRLPATTRSTWAVVVEIAKETTGRDFTR